MHVFMPKDSQIRPYVKKDVGVYTHLSFHWVKLDKKNKHHVTSLHVISAEQHQVVQSLANIVLIFIYPNFQSIFLIFLNTQINHLKNRIVYYTALQTI